jgi:hypothetical protein
LGSDLRANRLAHLTALRNRPGRDRSAARIGLTAIAATLLLFAVPLLAATPVLTSKSGEIHRTLDGIVRQFDLQTGLPANTEPAPWNFHLPAFLLLFVVAALLALLAYQFRDMIPAWRRPRGDAWSEQAIDPATGLPAEEKPFLARADELAAQGRLVEAMHAVLLQSIAEIRASLDQSLADSLTSREILRGTKLSDAGKAALHEIVVRVERFYFGAYPAAYEDYQACRNYFATLVGTLSAKGAA